MAATIFAPDGTPLYAFSSGIALAAGEETLARGATCILRVSPAGAVVQMYDQQLRPVASVRTSDTLGVFPAFYATAPSGVLDAGSVQLPIYSTDAVAAGLAAEDAVGRLRRLVEELQASLGGFVTDDELRRALGDLPTGGSGLPASTTDFGALWLQLEDAVKARERLGAGTSDLKVGTRATDALAGDWRPKAADVSDGGTAGREVFRQSTVAQILSVLGITAGGSTGGGTGGGSTTPTTPAPTPTPQTGTSTPARWWVPFGDRPVTRVTWETGLDADGRARTVFVSSMPDTRVGTSLLEVGVPVADQRAYECYVEDVTAVAVGAAGTRVAESGVLSGTAQSWTAPASFSPTPGRKYKSWARTQAPDGQWSEWEGTRWVAPTGRVVFFEDYGMVGDGVAMDGTDYPAGVYQGPLRVAIADLKPGDVLRSRRRGVSMSGLVSSGTSLTSSTAVFTSAMVGRPIMVYGGGYTDTRGTYVHRTKIVSVSADGKAATLEVAAPTAQTSARALADYPTYLVNHIDNDSGAKVPAGGFTIDGAGVLFTSNREDSAGFRTTLPDVTYRDVHYWHTATTKRGNGKNNDSGTFFFEGAGCVGARVIRPYAERSRDAGVLFYDGCSDWHVVDSTCDHTMADPVHVTGSAHHGQIIRPLGIYVGDDDSANIGYRPGGATGRPHHITWESPTMIGQDWGRGLSFGGCYDVLCTDRTQIGGAMAAFIIGSDGDQADTDHVQVRRATVRDSTKRAGLKPTYTQGASTSSTIASDPWLKLINNGSATRQSRILLESIRVVDGKFMQIVSYNGGAFDDASVILRDVEMSGAVNAGGSWVDQSTYRDRIDLRGVTPVGATKITTAPTSGNGTPPGSTGASAAPDTTRPTAPGQLTATRTGATTGTLSWSPATDDRAVTGYQVLRGTGTGTPALVATLGASATSYADSGLQSTSTYGYVVQALDAAGNVGAAASVTMPVPAAAADTTPPSTPGAPAAKRASTTTVDVSWTASTDDRGVTGYRIYRGAGSATPTLVATVGAVTSWTDTGLDPALAYGYQVAALDAAGNVSQLTAKVTAATFAAPTVDRPQTSAPMLIFSDVNRTAVGDAGRLTDLVDTITGKAWSWPTDTERPVVREITVGGVKQKVADFLNSRLLLDGTGIAALPAITVSLLMAQNQAVSALRSGYLSASPAGANDYDTAVGQWAIGNPSATGQSAALGSVTTSGAPSTGGNFTGVTRPAGTWCLLQVQLATDGTAPVVKIDGQALTSSAAGRDVADLIVDHLLWGARWFDGGPKDGQQFRGRVLGVNAGRINAEDELIWRRWAATTGLVAGPQ